MGYHTDFRGEFIVDKPVDEDTFQLLRGLEETRRMKRDPEKLGKRLGKTKEEIIELYGEECEFWVGDVRDYGQEETPDIINYNDPPKTQPSLWCNWEILDDHQTIEWSGAEKFYNYIEWIQYIIDNILKPRGYILNGEVDWRGEEFDDMGSIVIENNVVTIKEVNY